MAIDILGAFEHEPQPIDYVLPGMVAGTVGALVSPGGTGKSMLAMQLAATLASGGQSDLLNLVPLMPALPGNGPQRVMYLPAEDPEPALQHRLHHIGKHLNPQQRQVVSENMVVQPLIGHQPNIMDSRWTDYLMRVAEGHRLLILDTLRRFHTFEENDAGEMAQIIGRMEYIAKATGCAILFLHHAGKSAALNGQGDMQQASRGSSVLVDNIRWQSFVAGMSKAEAEEWGVDEAVRKDFVRFGVSKMNYGAPVADRWLRRDLGGVLVPAVLEKQRKRGGGPMPVARSNSEPEGNGRDVW